MMRGSNTFPPILTANGSNRYWATTLPPGTRLDRIDDKKKDGVRNAYTEPSNVWASVTPVILNRHVKKLKQTLPGGRMIDVLDRDEINRQLIQVLAQSGIDHPCEFEWSAFSHFRKMLSATSIAKTLITRRTSLRSATSDRIT